MGKWIAGPPLVVVLTAAAVYGAATCFSGWEWPRMLYLLFLIPPAVEDGRTGTISDGWSLLLTLTGLAVSLAGGRLAAGLAAALLMGLLFGAAHWLTRGGVGMGDVLLSAAVSLSLTPAAAFLALWLSCLAALMYIAARRLTGRHLRGVRFAPFWALGGGAAYAALELSLFPAWLSLP